MKYIDAEKLKLKIAQQIKLCKEFKALGKGDIFYTAEIDAFETVTKFIDSLQQEQPDFPTTDEQMKEFLATHPKVEVPNKYKTPDWLLKKQEQPEISLEKFTDMVDKFKARYEYPVSVSVKGAIGFIGRMFYQYPNTARQWYDNLPKVTMDNARKEESK